MEYLVLGALEVRDGDREVLVRGAKQRRLLGALLIHANAVVSIDRLAEILWGDDVPVDVPGALKRLVARLRSNVEPDASPDGDAILVTRAPGYMLTVEPDSVDAYRFERLVREAQQRSAGGDPAAAVDLLDEALELWRGSPYADFSDEEFARSESRRLEELRRVAIDERAEARAGNVDAVGETETIAATWTPPSPQTSNAPGDAAAVHFRLPDGDAVAAFVDRSDELDSLRRWLTESISGSPRVVVVTGDRGIGKSRLVTELIAEARSSGVRPFAGRCSEDSQIPFLGVAPVLDALGVSLKALVEVTTPQPLDDHGTRLAAVVDASRALMSAAADRPALLVLEDAQWADPATVEFVGHVVATLAHEAVFRQLPLMLLLTARPRDGLPGAQRLLGRASQEGISRTVHLGGLDELALFTLLEMRSGVRPSEALLHLVSGATAGNPLEVEQVLARLARVEALEVSENELASTVRDVTGIPVEADDDVGELLRSLSAPAKQLVTTIALLRDGRLETLRIATALDAEAFDVALDETIDAGLLEEIATRVDFLDGRARRAVVRTLSTRRRQRAHAEIARRLMDTDPDDLVLVTEIAAQMDRAGPAGDAEVLAQAAHTAGDHALALGMWNDAKRYFEAALRSAALRDADRAELERRAAIAAYRCNDPRGTATHADRAVALGRATGDLRIWGEAALVRAGVAWGTTTFDTRPLEAFLDAAGDEEPQLRARAHLRLSELAFDRLNFDESGAHAAAADGIAREFEESSILAEVEFGNGLQSLGSLDFDTAANHFARCEEDARRAQDSLLEACALGRQPFVLWARGELDRAEAAAARAARYDREHGWWAEYSLVAALQTGLAVAHGKLGAADRLATDAMRAARRAEPISEMSLLWAGMANARTLLGDVIGAQQALDEWQRERPNEVDRFRDLVDVSADVEAVDGPVSPMVGANSRADLGTVGLAASDVELADALGRPDLAVHALDVLLEAYARGYRFTAGWCWFVPRVVGVAYRLAGDHDAAEEWLLRAQDDAHHAGAAGELARVRYELARTRIAAGRHDDAADPLDAAIADFEQLGFRRLLVAARRLAGKTDIEQPGDTPSTRIILITDLVDSTPLNRRLGDQRFVELLREHNRVVRTRLRQFDGVEFKHTGDGIGATFFTAGAAIQCALGIQEDIARFNEARAEPLLMRIGISAGNVIGNEGDLFGLAVIEAFRVCDRAGSGQILVSAELPPLVQGANTFDLHAIGDFTLKGFSHARTLYEVVPS